MYKTLKADKDTYITNKFIKSIKLKSMTGSNVGQAGSMDLFKLYGVTMSGSTPNLELSRLLIHFDLDPLRSLLSEGKIDVNDESFFCNLSLKDIYGGQPTPTNFKVTVFPLSSSFSEGIGKDTTYYSDKDVCNWVSSSRGNAWYVTGCGQPCSPASGPGDYITSSLSISSTESTQTFVTGEEDLFVDVTKIVSATLSGELPDSGFRIAFTGSHEEDDKSYFVKRFGTRHSYREEKRPSLIFGYDDSVRDDTQNLELDTTCSVKLYNYSQGDFSNILSGNSYVEGKDCLLLRMYASTSFGTYNQYFTGSQVSRGIHFITGAYFADVKIDSSNSFIKNSLGQTGSYVRLTPIWTTLDETVTVMTGSSLEFKRSNRSSTRKTRKFLVTTEGMRETYYGNQEVLLRINIFDQTSPLLKVTKVPVEAKGIALPKVYYSIRDAVTNRTIIPFDTKKNSSKMSSDDSGMFFILDMSSLPVDKTYVLDVLIDVDGSKQFFKNVSPIFSVVKDA